MKYLFSCLVEQYLYFTIIIRALHVYQPGWYKKEELRPCVCRYYQILRIVLRITSSNHRELTRCAHCGIYIITSPGNRGRKNIRCSFGCREHHKKEASKNRSTAYYKTKQGQKKKREHNKNRYCHFKETTEKTKKEKSPSEETGSFVGHVRFIVSLIEGRFISWQKIKEILLEYFKKWRQHPLEYWLKLCNMTV